MQFINTKIKAGVWHGDLVDAGDDLPELHATHLGTALDNVTCVRDPAHEVWRVTVPIPAALISDGVQTFVISGADGVTLDSFTLVCGEPLTDDLQAEIAVLRSELDLLQKAFRHHCSET
ncbi:hypothetical protein [Yoonia sp.]|uniref:hypothetical protein n=1 Tax=Yoonia sp. TaxID=2212373 RepID=UPI003976675F